MSQAMKIGGRRNDKPQQTISQSIPTNFYRNYIPPTPKIQPMKQEIIMEDQIELPPTSNDHIGINITATGGSFSLKNNKHPMSLPSKQFMFRLPPSQQYVSALPSINNNKKQINNNNKNNNDDDNEDDFKQNYKKNDMNIKPNSKVISGSYTCFQLMTGPQKALNPVSDEDTDTFKSSTASTFDNQSQQQQEEDNMEYIPLPNNMPNDPINIILSSNNNNNNTDKNFSDSEDQETNDNKKKTKS